MCLYVSFFFLPGEPVATLIASSACKIPMTPGTNLSFNFKTIYVQPLKNQSTLPTPRTPLSTHLPTAEAGGGTG